MCVHKKCSVRCFQPGYPWPARSPTAVGLAAQRVCASDAACLTKRKSRVGTLASSASLLPSERRYSVVVCGFNRSVVTGTRTAGISLCSSARTVYVLIMYRKGVASTRESASTSSSSDGANGRHSRCWTYLLTRSRESMVPGSASPVTERPRPQFESPPGTSRPTGRQPVLLPSLSRRCRSWDRRFLSPRELLDYGSFMNLKTRLLTYYI